VLAVIEICCKS